MKLRHKRWNFATPLRPTVAVVSAGRRYITDGKNGGVIEVGYKQDVEELLNPVGDLQSDYEIAYDQYGISFDASGKKVEVIEDGSERETDTGTPSGDGKEKSKRGVGRPRGREKVGR